MDMYFEMSPGSIRMIFIRRINYIHTSYGKRRPCSAECFRAPEPGLETE